MTNLQNNTACVIVATIDDEVKYLSRFWDVSKDMWTTNWRQAELFDTSTEADIALKNLKRFGHEMTKRHVKISAV